MNTSNTLSPVSHPEAARCAAYELASEGKNSFLVVQFQTMENYGDDVKPHWKCKGGSNRSMEIKAGDMLACPWGGRYVIQNAIAQAMNGMEISSGMISYPAGMFITDELGLNGFSED